MATYSMTLAPSIPDDATFRTWVAALRDAIDQVATRSSDTGQIDTATATRSGSSNTASGYNLWELTDGLSDLYFKLEYGRGGTQTTPAIWVTFGTATDGAGTLSGATTDRRQINLTASSTPYTCLFSGDTNRLAMVLWHDHATVTSRLAIGVERDHLVDGTDDDTYYFAVYGNSDANASTMMNRCVKVAGDQWRAHGQLVCAFPDGSGGVLGLDIAAWPIRPIYGTERNPSRNWHTLFASDVASGTVFSADVYGETQTWVRTSAFPFRSTTFPICMRYD